MYVSDYSYAADPSYWMTQIYREDDAITRNSNTSGASYHINYTGYLNYAYSSDDNTLAVRPVFYLESAVNYASGNGTVVDPIRISA